MTDEEGSELGSMINRGIKLDAELEKKYRGVTGPKDEAVAEKLKKELEVLREEEKTLEARVKETNRGIAKAEGYIFENVQALMQAAYPDREIIEKEGRFYLDNISKKNEAKMPAHYKCPECGIVLGERKIITKAPRGSPHFDYTSRYNCRICDQALGK